MPQASHPQASHARTALITGASSGIGYEMAGIFARNGYHLVLVARGQAPLEELAAKLRSDHDTSVEVSAKDLSRACSPGELFSELQQKSIAIDILVNNAGFATHGPFAQSDLATELELLQLNIVSLTQLTRLVLPHMLAQRCGKILNVASVAAFLPGPLMATYYASKAYVLSFSVALANELQGSGVTITTLCPGPTRTKFDQRAGMSHTKVFQGKTMDPATVARVGYEALMKGKSVVIPGFKNRVQMIPTPLVPRRILAGFARKFNEA